MIFRVREVKNIVTVEDEEDGVKPEINVEEDEREESRVEQFDKGDEEEANIPGVDIDAPPCDESDSEEEGSPSPQREEV